MEQQPDFKENMGAEICSTLEGVGFDLGNTHTLQYYFYFPQKEQAEKLSTLLVAEGLSCEVDQSAGDKRDWLCLAKHETRIDSGALTALGKHFAALATELGGEFDGWERAPGSDEKLPPALAMIGGIQLYQQGEFAKAISMFTLVTESPSELASQVWPLIGLSHLKLGHYEEAIEALNKAIVSEPENVEHRLNLGVAWHGLKQYDRAISSYAEVLKLEAKHPSAHYNLACAYAKMENSNGSLAALITAIEGNKGFRKQAASDNDLESLRELPEFKNLLKSRFSKLLSKIGL